MLDANALFSDDLADIYFSAQVIDNNDVNKQGRVKIRVQSLHADISDADLPWASPQINISGLDVPAKQKYVWVLFQQGNRYEPIYLGYVLPKNAFSGTILAEDYPNTRGFYDGTNWVTINKKTGKIEIHTDVSSIVMDNSGITINSNAALNITINGACNITSNTAITLQAPIINCN